MNVERGEFIDGKFVVEDVCSDAGGMGALVFVKPVTREYGFKLVLKYCREPNEEIRHRFRREVRLLIEFQGNSKVVEIVDANVDHDPPYFVMRYYRDGDLLALGNRIKSDLAFQEKTFLQMIDCLAELHSRGKFHRDVKPQNFLVHDGVVVVSDFGLSKEFDSDTVATRSSQLWGTKSYLPPEFYELGGFKSASAPSDIFMLGKTFYTLLTDRDPTYINLSNIQPPIFTVIERCCATRPESRYQDLATLKQRLTAAYDVLFGRNVGAGTAGQLLAQINDKIKTNTAEPAEVVTFIEALALLGDHDRTAILFEIDANTVRVFTMPPVQPHVPAFLDVYRRMVEDATYGYSYAENIADNMRVLFDALTVSHADRTSALEIAILGAVRQNRYAAMDTCTAMIKSVRDEQLGHRVAEMLMQHPHYFLAAIEPSECRSNAIVAAVKQLKTIEGLV